MTFTFIANEQKKCLKMPEVIRYICQQIGAHYFFNYPNTNSCTQRIKLLELSICNHLLKVPGNGVQNMPVITLYLRGQSTAESKHSNGVLDLT